MTSNTVDHGFELAGGPDGVLLIHGLTGTPAEMRVLARGLNRAGFTVHAVQLAGHCSTVDDLVATRWTDWYASVCAAATKLRAQTRRMYVGGLSMGALLALKYAAEHPRDIDGVMAYSPVFDHNGWSIPAITKLGPIVLPVLKHLGIGRRWMFQERAPYGIKDVALRNRVVGQMQSGSSEQAGLPGNPWFSLVEFFRLSRSVKKQLHNIECPCLVLHAIEDDVAAPSNAMRISQAVSKADVRIIWLENSYHMITIDRDRRKVMTDSVAFMLSEQPEPAVAPNRSSAFLASPPQPLCSSNRAHCT